MLIFIRFVVVIVIVILKEQSNLNWLTSVPLPARLDYALPQTMLIPPVFLAASRFVFRLIRWSVKFGIVH